MEKRKVILVDSWKINRLHIDHTYCYMHTRPRDLRPHLLCYTPATMTFNVYYRI